MLLLSLKSSRLVYSEKEILLLADPTLLTLNNKETKIRVGGEKEGGGRRM